MHKEQLWVESETVKQFNKLAGNLIKDKYETTHRFIFKDGKWLSKPFLRGAKDE